MAERPTCGNEWGERLMGCIAAHASWDEYLSMHQCPRRCTNRAPNSMLCLDVQDIKTVAVRIHLVAAHLRLRGPTAARGMTIHATGTAVRHLTHPSMTNVDTYLHYARSIAVSSHNSHMHTTPWPHPLTAPYLAPMTLRCYSSRLRSGQIGRD